MSGAALILKEIRHRKLNFALMALGIITAVALFVAFFTAFEASERELTRITRDRGPDLRIVPAGANLQEILLRGFDRATMPQRIVEVLAQQEDVSYNHLTAMLYHRITLGQVELILAGMAESRSPVGQSKVQMVKRIPQGRAMLGSRAAEALGVSRGDEVELGGAKFTVDRVMVPENTDKDFTVFVDLAELQAALGVGQVVSEIHAIDCTNCIAEEDDPTPLLQAELDRAQVGATVIRLNKQADMRAQLRRTAERYFTYATPFLVAVCAVWVGASAMTNVRQRREEIGVLRALGYGSGRIAALFLGKSILAGLAGAALGFALGAYLAVTFGPRVFEVTAKGITADYRLLGWSLVSAPLFAAAASALPTLSAVVRDPAMTLRHE